MALSRWQMQDFKSWKGLTKSNHISALFGKSPQQASNIMTRMMEFNHGKSLESYLSRFPAKYFDEDDDYT